MSSPISQEQIKAYPAFWGMAYRQLRGHQYGFIGTRDVPTRHRPFLMFPLMKKSRVKGYKKSRQAGVSENSVTETLWMLDQHAINAVYTFPSPKQVEDFSNTRIKTALTDSQDNSLERLMGDPQNVTLRKIGKGYLYLRSATNAKLGEGIDADLVVFDEIDRMRRNVGVAFKESLSSSRFGWHREVSTPTLPNRGVDELWKKANQWHWFVKCEACGKEQVLFYPDNILELRDIPAYEKIIPPGSYTFCCSHCKSEKINRWDGKWRLTRRVPSDDHDCFQINQLMCNWISADQIMQKKRDYRFPQLFWNYVLGLEYASDNILITEAHMLRCIDTGLYNGVGRSSHYVRYSVGIDWGNLSWAVVFGMKEDGRVDLLNILMVEDSPEPLASTKQIAEFIRPFDPDIIVADTGYGKDRIAYLMKHFPERVYGCSYSQNAKAIEPRFTESSHSVTVDRTAWLKGTAQEYREAKIRMPSAERIPLIPEYIKQMITSVVMLEEDDDGNIVERIEETGDDHFFHASGYGLMGFTYFGGGSDFGFEFV